MNSANVERFSYSQLGAHFSYPSFSTETLTNHLQLYLFFLSGSQFENNAGRDLFGAQTLCIHEAKKIVVICEDKHLMLAIFEIVIPYLKNFNNS